MLSRFHMSLQTLTHFGFRLISCTFYTFEGMASSSNPSSSLSCAVSAFKHSSCRVSLMKALLIRENMNSYFRNLFDILARIWLSTRSFFFLMSCWMASGLSLPAAWAEKMPPP